MSTPVELRTLLPTLADLAGVDVGLDAVGASLAPALRDGTVFVAQPVFSELTLGSFDIRTRDRLIMVRDGSWKLSACLDPEPGELLLVDLESDADEHINRAADPAVAQVRDRLLALVVDHVAGAA